MLIPVRGWNGLRNCQIQVSKSVWKGINSLKNKGKKSQRCPYTPQFWGNTHPGPCYPSVAICSLIHWLFLLPGSEGSGSCICWQWEAVRGNVSPVRCQLLQGTLSLSTYLVLIDNNNKYFWLLIELLGSFAAPAETYDGKVRVTVEVDKGRGSSKALAEVTGLPVPPARRAIRSLKLINLWSSQQLKPLFKFKKKKESRIKMLKYLRLKGWFKTDREWSELKAERKVCLITR